MRMLKHVCYVKILLSVFSCKSCSLYCVFVPPKYCAKHFIVYYIMWLCTSEINLEACLVTAEEDVVSMADSTIRVEDIQGELFKIERIKDVLVRKESELRYM